MCITSAACRQCRYFTHRIWAVLEPSPIEPLTTTPLLQVCHYFAILLLERVHDLDTTIAYEERYTFTEMTPKEAPYGTWTSPISAELIAQGVRLVSAVTFGMFSSDLPQGVGFDDVRVDSVTGKVYRLEARPTEAGRIVVVDTATSKDVFGPGWNARTGVHEYGGAASIVHGGVLYFSNFKDGRVYALKVEDEKSKPIAVTPGASHTLY